MEDWRVLARGRLSAEEIEQASRSSRFGMSVHQGTIAGVLVAAGSLVAILVVRHRAEEVPFPLLMICFSSMAGLLVQAVVRSRFENKNASADMLYDMNPATIKVSSRGHTQVLKWEAFEWFDARAEGIWVYGQGMTMIFLPRRFLADEDFVTLTGYLSSRFKLRSAERDSLNKLLRVVAGLAVLGLSLFAYQMLK